MTRRAIIIFGFVIVAVLLLVSVATIANAQDGDDMPVGYEQHNKHRAGGFGLPMKADDRVRSAVDAVSSEILQQLKELRWSSVTRFVVDEYTTQTVAGLNFKVSATAFNAEDQKVVKFHATIFRSLPIRGGKGFEFSLIGIDTSNNELLTR